MENNLLFCTYVATLDKETHPKITESLRVYSPKDRLFLVWLDIDGVRSVRMKTNLRYWRVNSEWDYSINKLVAKALNLSKKEIICFRWMISLDWHRMPLFYGSRLANSDLLTLEQDQLFISYRQISSTVAESLRWSESIFPQFLNWYHALKMEWIATDFFIIEVGFGEPLSCCLIQIFDHQNESEILRYRLSLTGAFQVLKTKLTTLYVVPWTNTEIGSSEEFCQSYQNMTRWCTQRFEKPRSAETCPFNAFCCSEGIQIRVNEGSLPSDVENIYFVGGRYAYDNHINLANFFTPSN